MLLLSGLGAGALFGCDLRLRNFKYKLSVEIEVSGKRYLGHGVRQIYQNHVSAWPDQTSIINTYVSGEAFWIDVDHGPSLFLLLKDHRPGVNSVWNPIRYLFSEEGGAARSLGDGKIVHLKPEYLPGLLVFGNISDSSSAILIHPENIKDVYGRDARIISSELSITNSPLTRGIKDKIPWIDNFKPKMFIEGPVTYDPERYQFNYRDFVS
ncbi:hypothetical protein [Caulobacter sp. SSI4214]|uniref:hypothetical protein n=1 Tax=Caulobacter sp. SSI4214 TaxID=2575739 RepID=UPI00143A9A9F|nr:hypothetical protein [Caulobacter sp. SSI4214]